MHKIIFVIAALGFTGTLSAAQIVYPADGQTSEQQKSDEQECSTWAAENSGYDASEQQPATQVSTSQSGPSGARLRGAAKGALIGEIADEDTGDAAAVGAVLGGTRNRRADRKSRQQTQATEDASQNTGQGDYDKARAACLEGKGYSVK